MYHLYAFLYVTFMYNSVYIQHSRTPDHGFSELVPCAFQYIRHVHFCMQQLCTFLYMLIAGSLRFPRQKNPKMIGQC